MRYTTPITSLAVNAAGERQLETHHLDDNFAAQDDAIQTITRALFASGGVAQPGQVTLHGTLLRVVDRVGVALDVSAALHVTDQTLDLSTLPVGKGTVVMTAEPVTVQRTYTDAVTGESLTDRMVVSLGRLLAVAAGTAGVTLDAGGYPVPPQNTVPVAHVTRAAGGITLDALLDPALTVNAAVAGQAGADGVGVTGAHTDAAGHLILTLSDGATLDAGPLPGGAGGGTLWDSGVSMPETGAAEGAYYLDVRDGRLWRWVAGAWALAAVLTLEAPEPTNHIIAIGDSITYGSVAGQPGGAQPAWPTVMTQLLGWTLDQNAGIDGSTLTTAGASPMVNRLNVVPAGYSGQVYVMGGINDQDGGVPLGQHGDTTGATIYGALRTVVDTIMGRLGPAGRLVLMTPTYRTNEPTWTGNPPYTLEMVRQAIRDEAARGDRLYPGRVQLMDVGRDTAALLRAPNNAYLHPDNLHPNQAGQAAIGRYMAAHARRAGGPNAPVNSTLPDPIASYNMVQGADPGVLYAQAGPAGTVSGTWTAQGLQTAAGAGAQVDLGAARPSSGVMTLTTAFTPTNYSMAGAQVVAGIGTTPSSRGSFDTFALGLSGGRYYGFMYAVNDASGESSQTATSNAPVIISNQYDFSTGATTMWINGVVVDSNPSNLPILTFADTRLRIGYWRPETTGAAAFDGTVHYVRLDRGLTAYEVQQLHQQISSALAGRGVIVP